MLHGVIRIERHDRLPAFEPAGNLGNDGRVSRAAAEELEVLLPEGMGGDRLGVIADVHRQNP